MSVPQLPRYRYLECHSSSTSGVVTYSASDVGSIAVLGGRWCLGVTFRVLRSIEGEDAAAFQGQPAMFGARQHAP